MSIESGLFGYYSLSKTPEPLRNVFHMISVTLEFYLLMEIAIKNENMSLCASKSPLHTFLKMNLVILSINILSLSYKSLDFLAE